MGAPVSEGKSEEPDALGGGMRTLPRPANYAGATGILLTTFNEAWPASYDVLARDT